ncbi:MAG: deoxyribose-phosphate aldolase [Planctomycetes bacterium]|nr:deoxyribose-phosphate aldolase [Planctomycetota bacterium]MCC6407620.1 deoxyribose-phosphate aldolase [Planctomycetota bacterium]
MNRAALAARIDHTILKADATRAAVTKVVDEARAYGCASVCVNGKHVAFVARALAGSNVLACAVVGFPLGAMDSRAKAQETASVVAAGAREVDMVIDVGALKDCDDARVRDDIRAVVEAADGVPVKVILETCLLTHDEKVRACEASVAAGAAFVKTSTGFSTSGATLDDVRLMRKTVGTRCKVKASGGIRDLAAALAMIEAGADRLGLSATVAILEALPN